MHVDTRGTLQEKDDFDSLSGYDKYYGERVSIVTLNYNMVNRIHTTFKFVSLPHSWDI